MGDWVGGRPAENRAEAGFTLIELMVVVLIIGILIGTALPIYLGARARAQNRAAMSDLRNGVAAAKTVYTDSLTYTGITIAAMSAVEPALTFVAAGTPSSAANNYGLSFRVFNYGEVNMARLSESGECFYIRTIEQQGPAPSDVPGVYMGHRNGIACTGNQIAGYGTFPANFMGW